MTRNLVYSFVILIFGLTNCNPGNNYVDYFVETIYVGDSKEILTVFLRESGNIYLPIGSHSNEARNRKFAYYLMRTTLSGQDKYQNNVSELIDLSNSPKSIKEIDFAITSKTKNQFSKLTKVYSKSVEDKLREFVWDMKELGKRYIKTVGDFTVFNNLDKSGLETDTFSIFSNFKMTPTIKVTAQRKQYIDFFAQNENELYTVLGNTANDSLMIYKFNMTKETWDQLFKYDLRQLGNKKRFDWTFRLLPSYFKIINEDVEVLTILTYNDIKFSKTFEVGLLVNKIENIYELQTQDIIKSIELAKKASH